MKITIITVGKIKEKYWKMAIDEYSKRLSKYCRLDIIEVLDEKTPDNASKILAEQIKEKEGRRIIDKIPAGTFVITLEIDGDMLDSVALSKKISDLALFGKSHLVFIIGGSLGLHKKVSDISDYKLSFSKLTFPHQMMRVVLLEQIYRSYRIIQNEPYHK